MPPPAPPRRRRRPPLGKARAVAAAAGSPSVVRLSSRGAPWLAAASWWFIGAPSDAPATYSAPPSRGSGGSLLLRPMVAVPAASLRRQIWRRWRSPSPPSSPALTWCGASTPPPALPCAPSQLATPWPWLAGVLPMAGPCPGRASSLAGHGGADAPLAFGCPASSRQRSLVPGSQPCLFP